MGVHGLWCSVAESEARLMPIGVVKAFKSPLPPDEDPLVPQDAAARLGHMSAGAPSSFFDEFGNPTEEMAVNDPRRDGSTRPLPLPAGRNRIKDLSHDEAMELDERDRQYQARLARLAQTKRGMLSDSARADKQRGMQQGRRGKKPVRAPIGAPFTGTTLRPKGALGPGRVRVLDAKKRAIENEFRDLTGVRRGKTAAPVVTDRFSTPKPQMGWGRDSPAELFDIVQRKYEELAGEDMPEKSKNRIKERLADMRAFKNKHFSRGGWSPDTPWDAGHHGFSRPRGGGKQHEGPGKFVGVRGPQTKVDLEPEPKPESRAEPEPEEPPWRDKFLAGGNNLGALRSAEDPHPYPELILGMGEHGLGYDKPNYRKLMNIQNKKEEMRGREPLHDMSMFDAHDEKRDAIKLEHARKRAATNDPDSLSMIREKEMKALRNHDAKLPKPPESLTSQKLWQDILDWHGRTEAARREAGLPDIEKSYQVGVRRGLVGVV